MLLDTVSLMYSLDHQGEEEKEHRDINPVSTALHIYKAMMDNTDCELDRIQNDQGDKTLGMSWRDFLDQMNLSVL